MISCTEFIPLYSEFFTFMEEKGGHDAVVRYWEYLSDTGIGDRTNTNSLASFMERYGGNLEGARAYWGHTLTEEAADSTGLYDREKQINVGHMLRCPSKMMLLNLKHITPYYDYCGHCKVLYARVLEKFGFDYIRDHSKVDHAECSDYICPHGYEMKPEDFLPGPGKEYHENHSSGKKYLHRDFHLIGDNALRYCGEKYGDNGVKEFVAFFTRHHYGPIIEDVKKRGLAAIEEKLRQIYEVEEASELLHTELTEDSLRVTVDYSPAIAYMHTLGKEPSPYYIEETRTVYETLASESGYGFRLEEYREDGGAEFAFFQRGF